MPPTPITDDFEFFHDKGGRIAKSKAEFVAAIRTSFWRHDGDRWLLARVISHDHTGGPRRTRAK